MNKLVSIIVPVYKKKDTIQRCIYSITNQSYKNIEIILIDDGCPDGCGKICDEFAKKDNRIAVYHQRNQGVSVARNNGIKYAKGDYCSFVDADDVLKENFISELLSYIDYDDYDVDIVVGTNRNTSYKFINILRSEEAIELMFIDDNFGVNVWGKLYRKKLLLDNDFIPGMKMGEDMFALLKFISRAKTIIYLSKANYCQIGAEYNSIDNTDINEFYRPIEELCKLQRYYHNNARIYNALSYALVKRSIWTINLMLDRKIEKRHILKICISIINEYIANNRCASLKLKEKIALYLIKRNIKIYKYVYRTFLVIKRRYSI